MNAGEYFASFFYWSKCPFMQKLGNRFISRENSNSLDRNNKREQLLQETKEGTEKRH